MVPPPQPAWRRLLGRLSHFWLLVTFVVAWQLISVFGQRINPQLDVMMPPPTAVFSAAIDLLGRGVLFTHIFDSLYRVLLAVGTATVLGVPLGLAMGWSARFRAVVDPLLEFIRPIPPLAWIPLSILWFGLGDAQIVYIIFLAAFFPVVLNSMAGARDVDHVPLAGRAQPRREPRRTVPHRCSARCVTATSSPACASGWESAGWHSSPVNWSRRRAGLAT